MWKQVSLLTLIVALAACEGSSPNPVNGNPDPDAGNPVEPPPEVQPGDVIIPADIANSVDAVRWERGDESDPDDDILIITGLPLDDGSGGIDDNPATAPIDGTYVRAPSEDLNGYLAFFKQDDRLDRVFVALQSETADGTMRATTVADGGQFDRFFRGIFYERDGEYTPPDLEQNNGLVSYAGNYAAVTNLDDPEQNLRLDPRGADGTLEVPPGATPAQPRTIEGRVFVNVDFADNAVNGVIYDRSWSNGDPIGDEQYILLSEGVLDAGGNFAGAPLQELATVDGPPRPVGTFAGAIGGENASGMVGAFTASEHLRTQLPPDPEDPEGEPVFADIQRSEEHGIWVIPRCGEAGASTVCEELGDLDGIIDNIPGSGD